MFFKKQPEQPERYGCLIGSSRGRICGPTEWWLLPGCDHVGGRAQLCGPCKTLVDTGRRDAPTTFACPCGAPPIITPMVGGW